MDKLFREDLKSFKHYTAEHFDTKVNLDANESFININDILKEEIVDVLNDFNFNRYPSMMGEELCKAYGEYAGANPNNIMIGNGSDELIAVIVNSLLNEKDKVMKLNPDFSMYKIYTLVKGAEVIDFNLNDDFTFDADELIKRTIEEGCKLLFISNPNNPTSRIVPRKDIEKIITSLPGIVVLDEAYFEFYGETFIDKIDEYKNLIILRTASKIGLAALRLGFLITNERLMNELLKAKPPYNVNSLTQKLGTLFFKNKDMVNDIIKKILVEKDFLTHELKTFEGIYLYPSSSNFLTIKLENSYKYYMEMIKLGVKVRAFQEGPLKDCLRVTVGNREENIAFLAAFNKVLGN